MATYHIAKVDFVKFVEVVEVGKVFGVDMIDMRYVAIEVFVVNGAI